MSKPNVQIIGLFNSGTNLITNIIKTLYNVNIHPEGHTVWWKHSYLNDNFMKLARKEIAKTDQFVSVVIIKRLDWWKESMKRNTFTMTNHHTHITIGAPMSDSNTQFLCPLSVDFKNLDDYYIKFYKQALTSIPSNKIIVIKYCDILHNPKLVINQLSKILKLKNENIKESVTILEKILENPSKKKSKTHFYGHSAKKYHNPDVISINSFTNESLQFLKEFGYIPYI